MPLEAVFVQKKDYLEVFGSEKCRFDNILALNLQLVSKRFLQLTPWVFCFPIQAE